MTSPLKHPKSRQRDLTESVHEIQPGEKIARIRVHAGGADCKCLVLGCTFEINVPGAPRPVVVKELRDYYAGHRKHRHPDYVGRTQYDYQLGEGWKDAGNK